MIQRAIGVIVPEPPVEAAFGLEHVFCIVRNEVPPNVEVDCERCFSDSRVNLDVLERLDQPRVQGVVAAALGLF